jgi:predicted esterase
VRISLLLLAIGALFVRPGLALADPSVVEPSPSSNEAERRWCAPRWCAPELQVLSNDVCAFVPDVPSTGPRTLIIHLHGVIQPDTTAQWAQQRAAAKVGASYGFTVIMPQGRKGIGPTSMEHWWAWPTSIDNRSKYEKTLIEEWLTAKYELEKKGGAFFDRTYIFGFSNGAYYATSLAMRGRISVDGYALFAGGSGAAYHEWEARKTKNRVPIAVAWGAADPSHDKQEDLVKLLTRMRWPSIALGHLRTGHAMTEMQVAEALGYLGAKK